MNIGRENYEEASWGRLSELEILGFRRKRGCGTRIDFPPEAWYNCYTSCDSTSTREKAGGGERILESALRRRRKSFSHPYYLDQRSDVPEQYRAIGWVEEHLYSVIFEVREDREGEYYHLVSLWKATKEEKQIYEANA